MLNDNILKQIGRTLDIGQFVTLASAFFAKEGFKMSDGEEGDREDDYNNATTALGDAVNMIEDELHQACSEHRSDQVPHAIAVFDNEDQYGLTLRAISRMIDDLNKTCERHEKQFTKAGLKQIYADIDALTQAYNVIDFDQ